MKFNKKKVWTIAGIVAGVVILLLVIVYFSLSLILKSSVQTFGSMVMGVPVTVDRIDLKPFSGALQIRNLIVGNPEGYSTPHAFKLGTFEVVLVPSSLIGSGKLIIDKLTVDGMELNLETNLLRSNLSDIQKNINSFSGSASPSANKNNESESQKTAESRPMQINKIDLSDIKIYTIFKGGEDARVIPLMAPPVHLQDLGTGPEGITPVEVTSKIMSSLLSSVGKAVADGSLDLGDVLLDGTSSAGNKVGEGLDDAGKAVSNFLGSLMGNDKKK